MLAFHNAQGEYITEKGGYVLMIGRNALDVTEVKFTFA
jgi:hypothetical protein